MPMGEDWVKTIGKTTVRIVASSKHGIPFGRDILVVLYLIQEALRQGGPVIRFESMRHYLETFKLDGKGRNYKEAVERFKRVFYSSWFWEDNRQEGVDSAMRFHVIDAWNVFFDVENKAKNPLFDSFIELSPKFWEILKSHPIPYRLEAVVSLKDKPAALAMYLFLVYRTWQSWHDHAGKEFIPFFGPNGLKKQLSSDIVRVDHFREKVRGWLDDIRSTWPECPVNLEKETDRKLTLGKGSKAKLYKDGLFIEVKSVDQLHVGPHWPKERRLAREQEHAAIVADRNRLSDKQAAIIAQDGTDEEKARLTAGTLTKAEAIPIVGRILEEKKNRKQ